MGKLAVFWSPWSGRAGVTASVCAVAAALSTGQRACRMALTHTRMGDTELEGRMDVRVEERRETLYEKTGLPALILNFKQADLTEEAARRCGILLPGSFLELFPGQGTRARNADTEDVLFTLLAEKLRLLYDMTFVDTVPGEDALSARLLKAADVQVIVLPQHPYSWKLFLEKYAEFFRQDNVLFLIGNYLEKSEYGEKNFQKVTGAGKGCVAVIPKNEEYLDAMADGRVIEFFLRNEYAGRKEKNVAFMEQTRQAAEKLQRLADRKEGTGEVFVSGALRSGQDNVK